MFVEVQNVGIRLTSEWMFSGPWCDLALLVLWARSMTGSGHEGWQGHPRQEWPPSEHTDSVWECPVDYIFIIDIRYKRENGISWVLLETREWERLRKWLGN